MWSDDPGGRTMSWNRAPSMRMLLGGGDVGPLCPIFGSAEFVAVYGPTSPPSTLTRLAEPIDRNVVETLRNPMNVQRRDLRRSAPSLERANFAGAPARQSPGTATVLAPRRTWKWLLWPG
jgi:hypothetical protein